MCVEILTFPLQFVPNYYKFYRDAQDEDTVAAVKKFIQKLEDIIKSHPGGFVGERDSPAAVDFLIWPWFERLGALKILAPSEYLHKFSASRLFQASLMDECFQGGRVLLSCCII